MVEVREALYGFLGGTKACIASSFCVPKCSTFDSAPSSGSSGASAAASRTCAAATVGCRRPLKPSAPSSASPNALAMAFASLWLNEHGI